jgi:ssDNA-binding Zn-finger/Zn-ribbon topoisomerase 1
MKILTQARPEKDCSCPKCGSQEIKYDEDFGFYECSQCGHCWGCDEDDPDYDEVDDSDEDLN